MILRSFGRRAKSIGFTSASLRGVRRVQIGRNLLEMDGDEEKSRTVYVGNLCYDTSKRDLVDTFRACGNVNNIQIQLVRCQKGLIRIPFVKTCQK